MTNDVDLLRAATQTEIDLAITTLRGNGVDGALTADAVAECIAEQRRLDAAAKGTPMPLDHVGLLDMLDSIVGGLDDCAIAARTSDGGEGRTVDDVQQGIDVLKRGIARLVELHSNMSGGANGEAKVDQFQAYDEIGEILDLLRSQVDATGGKPSVWPEWRMNAGQE